MRKVLTIDVEPQLKGIDRKGNGAGVRYNKEIYYYQFIGKDIPKNGISILKIGKVKKDLSNYILVFYYDDILYLLMETNEPTNKLKELHKLSIEDIYRKYVIEEKIIKFEPQESIKKVTVQKEASKRKVDNISVSKGPAPKCSSCGDVVLIFNDLQKEDQCHRCFSIR